MNTSVPENIDFTEEKLLIRWQDGHNSEYNLLKLRKHCPCATCRGGDFGPLGAGTGHITEAWVTRYEYVGRYALKFTWNDGHETGFYTYKNLRSSCECANCRQ